MLFSLFVIIVACAFAGWVIYAVLSLAPWFPTLKRDIDVIDKAIQWRDDTVFYDLGSGDARVCLWLAERHPTVTFRAVEISFVLHAIAWVRLKMFGVTNVELIRGDALRHDVSDAHYVYVFGTHRTIDHIVCDLVAPQVKAGTQLISYNFEAKKWHGEVRSRVVQGHTRVFVYTKDI